MIAVPAAELWSRVQIGWPRCFAIVQFPNPPLLLALAGWVLAAASTGAIHQVGRIFFNAALAVWAAGEAFYGVNWFRRLLGVGVLIWIALRLAGGL
jgi:hypothetical protein